ncbi:MAG TPA: CDP-diacylglycerol--glycerol-3-phosphate 3-phosphatidyltransferase [Clostridiaceae bacterium]|nr:CDP-diacylglycerol--glycerol-3-phosphate 3-phosphatidyltransferase [Clostridiaceae bacterium]
MNIANKLTVSRILIIPFIILFILPLPFEGAAGWNDFVTGLGGSIIALVLFSLASLTDYLDGHFARKQDMVSNFGKFLDPIADKLLVISTFACLVALDRASVIVLIIIIAREFIVTGLRLMAAEKGVVIAASMFGKAKMVAQLVTIIYLLTEPIFYQLTGIVPPSQPVEIIEAVLVWVTVLMTVLSGVDYLWKNRRFFLDVQD